MTTRHHLYEPLTAAFVLIAFSLLVNIVSTPAKADSVPEERLLIKRQTQQSRPTAVSSSNGAQASSMAMSSVGTATGDNKQSNKLPANMAPIDEGDQGTEELVERRPVNKKLRPKARPKPKESRRDRYEDQDEYQDEPCDDDDEYDEYGNLFHSMAARPMRQFSRMMGHMFDQMQGMSSEMMYNNRPGGVFSSASASSVDGDGDDGGYSRTSAIVNNNGRAKGIISETRNGRTKTQRIGDD